jgi:hypothetical protein
MVQVQVLVQAHVLGRAQALCLGLVQVQTLPLVLVQAQALPLVLEQG